MICNVHWKNKKGVQIFEYVNDIITNFNIKYLPLIYFTFIKFKLFGIFCKAMSQYTIIGKQSFDDDVPHQSQQSFIERKRKPKTRKMKNTRLNKISII